MNKPNIKKFDDSRLTAELHIEDMITFVNENRASLKNAGWNPDLVVLELESAWKLVNGKGFRKALTGTDYVNNEDLKNDRS